MSSFKFTFVCPNCKEPEYTFYSSDQYDGKSFGLGEHIPLDIGHRIKDTTITCSYCELVFKIKLTEVTTYIPYADMVFE